MIAFQLDHQIKDILVKTCGDAKVKLPHFNYEWPLQALCSLKQGVDQLSAKKIQQLPPTHFELTKDKIIFDYEDRAKLIADVQKNRESTVNDLDTNEIEPNSFHAFMLLPCAQHYSAMEKRIVGWIKSHP